MQSHAAKLISTEWYELYPDAANLDGTRDEAGEQSSKSAGKRVQFAHHTTVKEFTPPSPQGLEGFKRSVTKQQLMLFTRSLQAYDGAASTVVQSGHLDPLELGQPGTLGGNNPLLVEGTRRYFARLQRSSGREESSPISESSSLRFPEPNAPLGVGRFSGSSLGSSVKSQRTNPLLLDDEDLSVARASAVMGIMRHLDMPVEMIFGDDDAEDDADEGEDVETEHVEDVGEPASESEPGHSDEGNNERCSEDRSAPIPIPGQAKRVLEWEEASRADREFFAELVSEMTILWGDTIQEDEEHQEGEVDDGQDHRGGEDPVSKAA